MDGAQEKVATNQEAAAEFLDAEVPTLQVSPLSPALSPYCSWCCTPTLIVRGAELEGATNDAAAAYDLEGAMNDAAAVTDPEGAMDMAPDADSIVIVPAVGSRIEITGFEGTKKWYAGTVLDFDSIDQMHHIEHDDGTPSEWYGLLRLHGEDAWEWRPTAKPRPKAKKKRKSRVERESVKRKLGANEDGDQAEQRHGHGPVDASPMDPTNTAADVDPVGATTDLGATTAGVQAATGATKEDIDTAATVDLAYSTWKDSKVHPWKDGHYLTAGRWFGCSKASEKYKCAISKFKQLQKLYQPSRPLCKHEVASHAARAISYGNWYPCRCVVTRCALQF